MNNADMPAMPSGKIDIDAPLGGDPFGNYTVKSLGLTKREHFAGLAMQAIIAAGNIGMPSGPLSAMAVKYAESILDELDKAK
jgi:hypothetical protein